MWCTLIPLVLLPTPILGQLSHQNNNPVIDLGYAVYEGLHNATSGINSWYGLRYAQAPVGELRWQAPVDIEAKNNYSASRTMDASQPGPSCVQGYPAWFPPPPGRNSRYTIGSSQPGASAGNVPFQTSGPGNALVYQSRGNLIYVTIQYRLGAYGFLGGSDVLVNGASNAGLLDQRAALMWVQRHISKFGGDPSKVTIIGGSAGGGSVVNQLMLYGGALNPPFRAAIAEYPWMQQYRNASALGRQYDLLRQASGCNDLRCLRLLPDTKLRSATKETITTAYRNGDYGFGDFFFGPYVDGSVIRDLPSNEFKLGHFAKVPLLTSREGYEGVAFVNRSRLTDEERARDLSRVFSNAKQAFFSRLFQLYPRADYNSTLTRFAAAVGDAVIVCPSSTISAALSDYGQPVWKMIFDAGSQTHGALQPFVETVNVGDSNNATPASIMRNYYISFATFLNPNSVKFTSVGHPIWPVYQTPDIAGFRALSVTHTTVEPSDDPDVRPQCDFFHSQSYVVRN
ncbi:hypothetical protein PRZ48_004777 [Zasmidium cellare]|uniref:Carboxylic ester hydrolase n=1 Tax=Zasmidium cellare TaxID=395010 RepID=A0ABR0EQP6_ZASCE|nr:hypothetical protein PRZ48_004777 [Zasmidium cellare]